VYYPDATSIQQHAQAALNAGWSGVVIWALGYETEDVYRLLGETTSP
jgi:spore germination protein YaaH